MEDFAIEDLKKTLELKERHRRRLLQNLTRLNESIARAESDIKSLEEAIKKCDKKGGKK